ncbi:MAG: PKD domain-containing protein [Saprospiraceae bacterium]|nr:PKD domain-containing protein [Candidatus Defluviibacterium haderslevense]
MNPAIIYLSNCRDTCSFSQADTCISVCSNKETVYFAVLHSGSSYSWSISGGLIIGNNNLESVTVSWTAGQVGNITLTETDSTGHSGSISYCVNIFSSPIAAFEINPIEICLNSPTYFIDQSIGAQDWFWDFGDGSTSSLQNPEHIYTTLGTFVISLRVTRREIINGFEVCRFECECSDTIKKEITITSIGPTICISTVCVGDTSCYKVFKSCPTSSFIWTVDNHGIIIDGGGTQDTFICINWINGEIGNITLLEQGCSGNYCNVPSIFEIPIIDINNLEIIGDTILCPGQTESYTIPKYMGTIYNWSVINGTINTPSPRSNNVSVTWSSFPGIGYLIVDIFHLEKGCRSRDTIKVEIKPSFSVLGQNKVCFNDTIKCYIPNLSGYTGDWIWNLSGGIVIGPANRDCIQILWNVPPGNYSISAMPVDTSYYCIQEASFLIKVYPKPVKPFLSSGPIRICPGGTYVYSADANPLDGEIYWFGTKWHCDS